MQTNSHASSKASHVIASMSDTMITVGEGCTIKDLKRHGFRQIDIDRYGEAAQERASERARLN